MNNFGWTRALTTQRWTIEYEIIEYEISQNQNQMYLLFRYAVIIVRQNEFTSKRVVLFCEDLGRSAPAA